MSGTFQTVLKEGRFPSTNESQRIRHRIYIDENNITVINSIYYSVDILSRYWHEMPEIYGIFLTNQRKNCRTGAVGVKITIGNNKIMIG